MKKINVAILFGGRSGEHEVSLTSAKNIISALDKEKYDIFLIGIDKEGRWHYQNKANFLLNETNPKLISLNKSNEEVFPVLSPEKKGVIHFKDGSVVREKIDVVIPVLHGPFGEDGTVQGLLEVANLPYVGSDTIGSSVGMDKDVMKRLLQQAGIPIPKFITFNHVQFKNNEISFNKIKESLGLPFFVKPVNLGSSVGISKVSSEKTFEKSVQEAFQYDLKIIFEEKGEVNAKGLTLLRKEQLARTKTEWFLILDGKVDTPTVKKIENKANQDNSCENKNFHESILTYIIKKTVSF